MKNLVGNRYGKLTVLWDTGEASGYKTIWHCKCDCGETKDVSTTCLLAGYTKSCGCMNSLWKSFNSIKEGVYEQSLYEEDTYDDLYYGLELDKHIQYADDIGSICGFKL